MTMAHRSHDHLHNVHCYNVMYNNVIIVVCDMMSLTLSEFKCKRQQGLSPGQELRKILPYDDCFEHPLHSVHGSADHWPCGGLLPWFLFLLL